MGEVQITQEKVAEKYIVGCIYDQNVLLSDLVTGPRGSESALRLEPGQVLDLTEYFSVARLKRSRSLKLALGNEWLVPCASVDEVITPKQRIMQSGEAPINEFDMRLAEELDKEDAELERLKSSRDALGARARLARAQQSKGSA